MTKKAERFFIASTLPCGNFTGKLRNLLPLRREVIPPSKKEFYRNVNAINGYYKGGK